MAYDLGGKMFTKAPIGEFGLTVDEKRKDNSFISIYYARSRVNGITLTLEWNYIPLMRVQAPYRLSVTEDPFVLDAVMKK